MSCTLPVSCGLAVFGLHMILELLGVRMHRRLTGDLGPGGKPEVKVVMMHRRFPKLSPLLSKHSVGYLEGEFASPSLFFFSSSLIRCRLDRLSCVVGIFGTAPARPGDGERR